MAVITRRWGSPDNAQLVAACLAGDARAFEELVTRYHGRLIAFVNRMIGDRERAEDLVQEAFIRVYRHLHRFDPTKKFSTWIYTIASNLAKNELRNRNRSPLVLLPVAPARVARTMSARCSSRTRRTPAGRHVRQPPSARAGGRHGGHAARRTTARCS